MVYVMLLPDAIVEVASGEILPFAPAVEVTGYEVVVVATGSKLNVTAIV